MTYNPKALTGLEILTIGVYGSTETDFFQKLQEARVDLFCDIRMRRAVRGSQYAFVNSQRLQAKLGQLHIPYLYAKELAPTKDIRQKQKDADAAQSIQKRNREELGASFIQSYKAEVLQGFSPSAFIKDLGSNVRRIVFFCVEAAPAACHRSIVADKIAYEIGLKITHL